MKTSEFTEISTEVTNTELLKIKKFISEGAGINVTGYCANNLTLFLSAAEYGHLDIVKYLMDKGKSC